MFDDPQNQEDSAMDDGLRRQWRRIAKEGRDFLCNHIKDKAGPEEARELYNAVNSIKAERASQYDWEKTIRETLPEPVLDTVEDPKWDWNELFVTPAKNPGVQAILNEYEATRKQQNLIGFLWVPPDKKKPGKGGGQLICLATDQNWVTSNFRTYMSVGIPDNQTGEVRTTINVMVWNKKNLINPE